MEVLWRLEEFGSANGHLRVKEAMISRCGIF